MAATAPQASCDNSVYVLPVREIIFRLLCEFNHPSMLQAAASEQGEIDRLEKQHAGLQICFGDKLSLAPIGNPQRILELGAGSGEWAIQAAKMYPDAEVIAADIMPLPPRVLPSNVKFVKVDLTKDLPFTPETYDIVHMRFVLGHVPNGPDVLRRAVKFVKPGGWFIAEDLGFVLRSEDMRDSVKRLLDIVVNHMHSYGADPEIGHKLEGLLRETGLFSQVSSTQIHAPYNPATKTDYKSHVVGQTLKTSFLHANRFMAKSVPNLNLDIIDAFEKEVNDPDRSYFLDFYLVSAQRASSTV